MNQFYVLGKYILSIFLYYFIVSLSIYATVIDIRGNIRKKTISISDKLYENHIENAIFKTIRERINLNLNQTSCTISFLENKSNNEFPRFSNYNLSIKLNNIADNLYKIDFILLDIKSNNNILNGSFYAKTNEILYFVNDISDQIVMNICGYNPFFNSKITYITSPFSETKRHIAVIDRNGNGRSVIGKNDCVYTPVYLDNKIFYINLKTGTPQLNFIDLNNFKEFEFDKLKFLKILSIVTNKNNGLNFMSIEHDKMNSYEMTLKPFNVKKIFSGNGIILSPNKINDDMYLVEKHNKGISNLYKINKLLWGNWHSKVSKTSGKYLEPKISPDGKWIVFTKSNQGKFSIGIMTINGEHERTLFSSFRTERPSWSPNSMEIIFSYKDSSNDLSKLKIIDIYGNHISTLKSEQNMLEPYWFVN